MEKFEMRKWVLAVCAYVCLCEISDLCNWHCLFPFDLTKSNATAATAVEVVNACGE